MGACYSGHTSKTCPSNETICRPIEPLKRQLSYSHQSVTFAQQIQSNLDSTSMSSQPNNRNKIPTTSSKLTANHNKVIAKSCEEHVFNKYRTRRYEASVDVSQVMICDNSSTTSISSDCSINLSKASKSTSSSASNISRLQTSIPKAVTSRTPTPPNQLKYSSNLKKPISVQNKYNCNNSSKEKNSSLTSDLLNDNGINISDTKTPKNRTITYNESNGSKPKHTSTKLAANDNSIKYTTQVSGLPRPQTAHIVSTSSQRSDKILDNSSDKTSNYGSSRLRQYSDNKNQNLKCDPSLRQIKPYFYQMNNNKPYERPNTNNNGNHLAYNRLHYQQKPLNLTKPVLNNNSSNNNNNNNNNQNKYTGKSFTTNGSLTGKVRSSFEQNMKTTTKEMTSTANNTCLDIINHNNVCNSNNNNNTDNVNNNNIDNDVNCKSNDNSFLPKSIQTIRELTPKITRKDSIIISKNNLLKSEKSFENNNSITGGVVNANNDFLIDDEISDQPELVLNSTINKKQSKKSMNNEETHVFKPDTSVISTIPSSPSVSLSTSSSTTTTNVIPNITTFRKPRPLSLVEMPDGSVGLDSPSFRAATQDLIGIKTLLFRLHGLLQNAETLNPFENNYNQNRFYNQLIVSENDIIEDIDSSDLSKENFDLKRQIVLQQQIIEDKERTIRLLQQQMSKYLNINNNGYVCHESDVDKVNASCQTDCCKNDSNINPRVVSNGSNGMLVSMCCSHTFDDST